MAALAAGRSAAQLTHLYSLVARCSVVMACTCVPARVHDWVLLVSCDYPCGALHPTTAATGHDCRGSAHCRLSIHFLSAAVTTVVTVAEILKSSGYVDIVRTLVAPAVVILQSVCQCRGAVCLVGRRREGPAPLHE